MLGRIRQPSDAQGDIHRRPADLVPVAGPGNGVDFGIADEPYAAAGTPREGLTPYEFIRKRWTAEPQRFILNPLRQTTGLNTQ